MERVLGIQIDGSFKAYAFRFLKKQKGPLPDTIAGKRVLIHFDKQTERAYATDLGGRLVPSITTFWFAWEDFYPQTDIVRGD